MAVENAIEGNSHLFVDHKTLCLEATTAAGALAFQASPNREGYLGKLRSERFRASSLKDAERRAYQAVSPTLNNLALYLDVPVHVGQIDTVECQGNASQMTTVAPYLAVLLPSGLNATLSPELQGCASLYQEALSTNSIVYRFLCFYKSLESISARRKRLALAAKAAGRDFEGRHPERVPQDPADFLPWLTELFPAAARWDAMALNSIFVPEAVGRKVTYIRNTHLRPLRNKVAHALTSDEELPALAAGDDFHHSEIQKWLPITKCCARLMLRNEFPSEMPQTEPKGPASESTD